MSWIESIVGLIAPKGYKEREERRAAEEASLRNQKIEANIAHDEALDTLLKSAAKAREMNQIADALEALAKTMEKKGHRNAKAGKRSR